MTTTKRTAPRRRPSWPPVWWAGLCAITWGLHRLGGGQLAAPPWSDPTRLAQWWRQDGTLVASFSVLRVGVVAIGVYLIGLGVVGMLWHVTRWHMLLQLLRWVTVPGLRIALLTAIGISAVALPVAGAANSPTGPASVMPASAPPTATIVNQTAAAPPTPVLHFLQPTTSVSAPDTVDVVPPTPPGLRPIGPTSIPIATTPTATPRSTTVPAGAASTDTRPLSPTSTAAIPPATAPATPSGATSTPSTAAPAAAGGPTTPAAPAPAVGPTTPTTPAARAQRGAPGASPTAATNARTSAGGGAPGGQMVQPLPGHARASQPSTGTWPDDPAATRHTVVPGDSLWSIASDRLSRALGHPANPTVLAQYWWHVVEVNRPHLSDPANPDLLFPGEVVQLPPLT